MTNETTASQPKSIGDDAQFLQLLTAVETAPRYSKELSEASAALITAIDSKLRAPADQASATIQAAPEEVHQWRMRTPTNDASWHDAPKFWAYERVDGNYEARTLYRAATIQEPVMVAEPVDASGLSAAVLQAMYKAFQRGDSVERAHAAVMALVAAPMVADPAGVAVKTWEERAAPDTSYWGEGSPVPYMQAEINDLRAALAATVKAVPSEWLEVPKVGWEWLKEKWDSIKEWEVHDATGRREDISWKAFAGYINEYFAAPLADKTGGGE